MKRPPGEEKRDRPKRLRRESTDAEHLLWRHLRDRQIEGYKFRRQMWLRGFIADFACVEARLVVEADGSQHADAGEHDRRRSAAFRAEGYRTLRFWNNDILQNIDGVLAAIREALPSPPAAARRVPPLPERERESDPETPFPTGGEGGPNPLSHLGRGRGPGRRPGRVRA